MNVDPGKLTTSERYRIMTGCVTPRPEGYARQMSGTAGTYPADESEFDIAGFSEAPSEVVHIWLRDDLVDEDMNIDPATLMTIGRMGGGLYSRTRERFSIPRGPEALNFEPPFAEDVGAANVLGAEESD